MLAGIFFLGPKAVYVLILAVGAIAAWEYYHALKKPKALIVLMVMMMLFMMLYCSKGEFMRLFTCLFVIVLLIFAYNLFVAKEYDITVSLLDFWGFCYIGVALSLALYIVSLPSWLLLIGFVIALSVLNDTMAYFIGICFGKHKFCPVSPKKSVEGAIAGVCASVGVSVGFALCIRGAESLLYAVILGVFAGIAGELGDLCASMIKRKYGVKDFGNIMPGHGGVLDRIDNILFTLPAVYCCLALFFDLF